MSTFFEELKRRNVIKAAIAYIVVAWVLLQVLSIVLPNAGAPEWVMKTLMILMLIGFPIWVFISWVYEVTPEGIKKTKQVDVDKSISATTNKRLNVLILVGLVLAIAVNFFNSNSSNGLSNSKNAMELDNSIAVLYFDDISSGGDTEWFCDGVTEDILTNLSKIKELRVISKTSTKRYKNTDKSIPEIAKELGVSYIVEGSVRKHENKVIITAQLIDANDKHLWAQNYNDDFKEVFKIQQDVSQKIVNQLRIAISPEETKEMVKIPTTNLKAYELVLKGRNFKDKLTKENYLTAIDFFKQAIALDPTYAQAYAELAYAEALSIYQNTFNSRDSILNQAGLHADKAIALDPKISLPYSTKGVILTESSEDGAMEKSESLFKKALELNSNDSRAHLEFSIYYSDKKDSLNSLLHAKKAYELDPFSIEVNLTYHNAIIENEKFEEAESNLSKAKSFLPLQIYNLLYAGLIEGKAKSVLKHNGSIPDALSIFKNALLEKPKNAELHNQLGLFCDNYLNDDTGYVKYTKNALDLETSEDERSMQGRIFTYHNALLENNQFDEAMAFRNTKEYKSITKLAYLRGKFHSFYHQKKHQKALEVLKDSLFNNRYSERLNLFSQMGEKEKIYEILANNEVTSTQKAFAFANLKERDSLYHYLEKDNINFGMVNSRREFDLYRKEDRYIAFMKDNNLPVLED
ncbi:MAG: hypothetical protein IMY67_10885 [Bacteroidetes bacterium]|nr:hypothetical protein [Bacteroidota bacterium]